MWHFAQWTVVLFPYNLVFFSWRETPAKTCYTQIHKYLYDVLILQVSAHMKFYQTEEANFTILTRTHHSSFQLHSSMPFITKRVKTNAKSFECRVVKLEGESPDFSNQKKLKFRQPRKSNSHFLKSLQKLPFSPSYFRLICLSEVWKMGYDFGFIFRSFHEFFRGSGVLKKNKEAMMSLLNDIWMQHKTPKIMQRHSQDFERGSLLPFL